MNVLAALLVLGLLIVIHEAGHVLAARFQGIRVNGFSIGFGSLQTRQLFDKLGHVAMINLKVVLCHTKVRKIGTLARRNEKL